MVPGAASGPPPDWTPSSQCHHVVTVRQAGGSGESKWSRPTRGRAIHGASAVAVGVPSAHPTGRGYYPLTDGEAVGMPPEVVACGWQAVAVSRGYARGQGRLSVCLQGRCERGCRCRAACRYCYEHP